MIKREFPSLNNIILGHRHEMTTKFYNNDCEAMIIPNDPYMNSQFFKKYKLCNKVKFVGKILLSLAVSQPVKEE